MITLSNIVHHYDGEVVLDIPSFTAAPESHGLVLGQSGSGKTTLLHIMAGVLRPTQGQVSVAGQDLSTLSGDSIDRFRGRQIGIVFQETHLMKTLTVVQNLLMAPYLAGLPQDRERAGQVLASLDVGDKADAYPAALSTGQRQRVAIARAVMNRPDVLLADEPTSSLDDVRSAQVLDLLTEQAEAHQATLLIATHDRRVKDRFPNRLDLDEADTRAPATDR